MINELPMSETATALIAAGFEHHQACRLDDAEHLYRRALDLEPKNADAMHLLGLALKQQGRLDKAVELLTGAVALRDDPGFYFSLALAMSDLGRGGETVSCLQQAVKLAPDFAMAWEGLGMAWEAMGCMEEAETNYRQALGLQADLPHARQRLDQIKMDKHVLRLAG